MADPLLIVDCTVFIKGRGLLLLSRLDPDTDPPVRVRVGDEIELFPEDGGCIGTTVTGVETVHGDGRPDRIPLVLFVSLVPDDHHVLRGAKVRVVTAAEALLPPDPAG